MEKSIELPQIKHKTDKTRQNQTEKYKTLKVAGQVDRWDKQQLELQIVRIFFLGETKIFPINVIYDDYMKQLEKQQSANIAAGSNTKPEPNKPSLLKVLFSYLTILLLIPSI
ncbi:MAG: hypothetical protein EZS28_034680 [Streblomastix strix]|uniref:Uncharacterized protein n=1 Tax=Streblomastix strix TaxID=222440 RepID=A0A5J4UI17_9EUKA|nr:MAG: hypothetical protein EZS28_034680 [Streblomastix strix]